MGRPRNSYPLEELKDALENSRSVRQALIKVGLKPEGANYTTIYKIMDEMNIDKSHMTGQGWNKGDVMGLVKNNTRPLDEILVENSTYTNTHKIKKRLIAAGLKDHVCETCGLQQWNGQQISLELDHINGDRFDHRLENLQLLCPNCHSQTPSYRGKNKRNGYLNRARRARGDAGTW
jgi:HNH endonuclease